MALRFVCPKVKLWHAHDKCIFGELEVSVVGKFGHTLPKMNAPLASNIV